MTDTDRPLEEADAALLAALAASGPSDPGDEPSLTLAELAERTNVPATVLEAIEREGFLVAQRDDGEARYAAAEADAAAAGMELLEAGLPLGELLDLARHYDDAMRGIADHAVELFLRFVRDPVRADAASDDEAAERLVGAFHRMLPATGRIVSHHFQRLLLERARLRATQELEERAAEPRS
ncbi:MAG: MerR family transcriptional regulator [Nitriliruptorales bacterium]